MQVNNFFLWLRQRNGWIKFLVIVAILYVFLLGVNCLGTAFKSFGEGFANKLLEGGIGDEVNPWLAAMVCLCLGLLTTSLVQSSSATTSMVVGLVATGSLDMQYAVPMVMGANLGTTVTNTLVSLGHITRPDEFRRAFCIATLHDFFNVLTIIVLLPIEIYTHFLENTATWITDNMTLGADTKFHSPVKLATEAVVKPFQKFLEGEDYLNLGSTFTSLILLTVAMLLIFFALFFLTKVLRMLMKGKVEMVLNRVLSRNGYLGILIGCIVTASVQSSSITTSVLVPLVGAALITAQQAFPITLGANLGTTITAIIASSATEKGGLTIALVHLMFNVLGIVIFYPIPFMRRIPLKMAEACSDFVTRRRYLAIVFIIITFYVIPGLFILIYQIVIH